MTQLPTLSNYLGQPLLLAPFGQSEFVDQLGGLAQPITGGIVAALRSSLSGLFPTAGPSVNQPRFLLQDEISGSGEGAKALYDDLSDGVATIRISGPIYDRAVVSENKGGLNVYREGYDRIRLAHQQAQLDPRVEGIVFELNSPGGLVLGCFEACDDIRADRAAFGTPVRAIVTGSATSAAYALAASTDYVTASSTAMTGSIGVMLMLSDTTGWGEKIGVKGVPVTFGDFKADGFGGTEFGEEELARIRALVAETGRVFANHVAAGRNLKPEDVIGQQAGIFTGQQGLAVGLVDKIQGPRGALADFRAELSGTSAPTPSKTETNSQSTTKETAMSVEKHLENLLEAGNSTLSIPDKAVLATAMRTAKAMDEKEKAEDDDTKPKAEGDDDKPKAEGDDDKPKSEGDDDKPKAEGDDDAPKAEGDDDKPKAEDDDETPEARASAIMTFAAANGHLKMGQELLNNKKLSSVEAIKLMNTAQPEATATLKILEASAPDALSGDVHDASPSASSSNPVERMKAAQATLGSGRRRR